MLIDKLTKCHFLKKLESVQEVKFNMIYTETEINSGAKTKIHIGDKFIQILALSDALKVFCCFVYSIYPNISMPFRGVR